MFGNPCLWVLTISYARKVDTYYSEKGRQLTDMCSNFVKFYKQVAGGKIESLDLIRFVFWREINLALPDVRVVNSRSRVRRFELQFCAPSAIEQDCS
jgi:hypothetical protein